MYYVEYLKNKNNEVIGLSKIQYSKSKLQNKSITEIDMNNIAFKDYKNNVKDYYLSGNTLVKIVKE